MIQRLKNLWNLTADEMLNKVTWPTAEELRESTILVLVASIILALVIYAMDMTLGKIITLIYQMFI